MPLLIGLDVLTEVRVTIDFTDDILSSNNGQWSILLRRKLGHLYVVWDDDICFTETEVRRLHRHFYHPSDTKLMALIERAKPEEANARTKSAVTKVRNVCAICHRNAQEPSRFRVSMPQDYCVFNRTVAMDIMLLDNAPELHCVDKDAKFGAAAWLPRITAQTTWQTYLYIWANTYIGHPNTIVVDQATQFIIDEFVALCSTNIITI